MRWFHSGGIFAALSPTTGEVIIEGMKAAKAAGAVTSFDLNYRAKLWNIVGGHEHAVEVLDRDRQERRCARRQRRGSAEGPRHPRTGSRGEVEARSERVLRHDGQRREETSAREDRRHDAARSALDQPPQLERRGVDRWQNATWRRPCELDVIDRVGGGDGYAAGFFYGLLSGESPEEAVKLGWAHGALLTTFPGDTTMATVEQVRAFAKGGSARIQR